MDYSNALCSVSNKENSPLDSATETSQSKYITHYITFTVLFNNDIDANNKTFFYEKVN